MVVVVVLVVVVNQQLGSIAERILEHGFLQSLQEDSNTVAFGRRQSLHTTGHRRVQTLEKILGLATTISLFGSMVIVIVTKERRSRRRSGCSRSSAGEVGDKAVATTGANVERIQVVNVRRRH